MPMPVRPLLPSIGPRAGRAVRPLVGRFARALGALALTAATTVPAFAHNAWLLPSSTILSAPAWITVDAAVSNDLFFFNHNALPVDDLVISSPDGQSRRPENVARGKLRTTFDTNLEQPGTWKWALVRDGLFASWKENGAVKRWRGTPERFATEVPANAEALQVTQNLSRLETFVTVKAPTETVLAPSGRGLEFVPVTHPNDLVAGEDATFRFLLDGQPLAGLTVTIAPGNVRYRDRPDEFQRQTDRDGRITVRWPGPGMYWLEADHSDAKTSIPAATQRRLAYAATLEVMPR